MSNIERVCGQCGGGNPVEARFCAHCGSDTQATLPAPRTSLPMVIGQAALPVLVGAAGLALRVGWKLLKNRLAQATVSVPPVQQVNQPPAPQTRTDLAVSRGGAKRTVHIRSSWAVNNGNGVWQQGHSEHTIEMED